MEIWAVLRLILLGVALTFAVIQDGGAHKIRNWLSVSTALLGGALCLPDGLAALQNHAVAFCIMLAVGLALWLLGAFRAGDAKFYAALAALMGAPWIVSCFAYSMMAGGVIGGIVLLKKHALRRRLCRLWDYVKSLIFSRKFETYQVEPGSEGEFPFAISIAMGAALALLIPLF